MLAALLLNPGIESATAAGAAHAPILFGNGERQLGATVNAQANPVKSNARRIEAEGGASQGTRELLVPSKRDASERATVITSPDADNDRTCWFSRTASWPAHVKAVAAPSQKIHARTFIRGTFIIEVFRGHLPAVPCHGHGGWQGAPHHPGQIVRYNGTCLHKHGRQACRHTSHFDKGCKVPPSHPTWPSQRPQGTCPPREPQLVIHATRISSSKAARRARNDDDPPIFPLVTYISRRSTQSRTRLRWVTCPSRT